MKTKLNIAFLLDNEKTLSYEKEIIDTLLLSEYCTVTCIIYKQPLEVKHNARDFSNILYNTYRKIDTLLFGKGLKNIPCPMKSDKIKKVYLSVSNKGQYDDISMEETEKLETYDIDVVIDLSKSITIGALLEFPKYGVWRFMHSHKPEGFWEVIESQPYTEITLQKISENLAEGATIDSYRTITDLKSPLKNLDTISWRAHMLIEKNIKRLYDERDIFFSKKVANILFPDQPSQHVLEPFDVKLHFSGDEKKSIPNNYQMMGVFFKLAMKFSKIFFRKHFTKLQWFLMYVENDTKDINLSLLEYKKIVPRKKDLFWADPFVIDESEKSYVFYEEFSPSIKGSLWVITYDSEKKIFSEPEVVMDQEYHLSYPFIFDYNGSYYMIPETAKNETVDLYIAEKFPHKWKKVKTILENIVAVDTTIHYYNNKWWMFTNIAPKKGFSNNDELYIYYCNDFLIDEWIPHRLNPVITDSTIARNAGKIIEKEGVLYRPSQYCGGYYGRFLNINKIDVLNELEYKETVIGRTSGGFEKDLEGIHTLNSSKNLTIIDVGARWLSLKR